MEKNELLELREMRGKAIASNGASISEFMENAFLVPSQSGNGAYKVLKHYNGFTCSCPDYKYRKVACKHIFAIKFWQDFKEYVNKQGKFVETKNAVPSCFYCSSQKIVKRGMRKNKGVPRQRFYCKECNKYFIADKDFQGIKVTPEIATLCLDLFFKGLSLRKIKDTLEQFYGAKISHETVRNYITVFMEVIEKNVHGLKPENCDSLHTDETFIKENGKMKYCWNTLDRNTRFLLASNVTERRNKKDAKKHFKIVKEEFFLHPKQITTDGLLSYHQAIKETFNSRKEPVKHERSIGFIKNQRIERLHNSQKERLKVMRGFNGQANRQMRDWKNYYNFARPYQGLSNKTPAQASGITNERKWIQLIKGE